MSAQLEETTVNDEVELRWAAIERLPTYERMRKGILREIHDDGRVVESMVDLKKTGKKERKLLTDLILNKVEQDNEEFLGTLQDRIHRVGIETPTIELRYQNLSVEGDVHVGHRALPTLLNATMNFIEEILGRVRLAPSKKKAVKILENVSGIVKPSRMTLLLGPPGSGKTTLLLALAGKLDKDLRVNGKITYCGHDFNEFVPQRTCAYISQTDLHFGEMTVRETLDFSARCLGVGDRYDLLAELLRREKEAQIKPDPEIDAFMKAISMSGQKTSLVTDYVLKILGLDICSDVMVGDQMRRGISGGQKKRVTTGEMLVGPSKVLLMDEISIGLDSSTTFQICEFLRQIVHVTEVTMIMSLLQPAPETYDLFDDVILISEGKIVYHGPRDNVLEFFESMGFTCPYRKGVADFLQEVTSKKDQEQYWTNKNQPYSYISVNEFSKAFKTFYIGHQLAFEMNIPYDKSKTHKSALVRSKYGLSNWDLFKACFSREWLLIKRNSFVYIFKTCQITIMSLITLSMFLRTTMHHQTISDGGKYLGALFFSLLQVMFNGTAELGLTVLKLPVFYKQRDCLFYPAWAYALPIWVLRLPLSFVESGIWVGLTYYSIGFAPGASRFFRQFLAFFSIHQMALSLFRFLAAIGRTMVLCNTVAIFSLLLIFVLGGFIIDKDDIPSWMLWAYYASPMMYGQNAIAINEFLDKRWSTPNFDLRINQPTIGKLILASRGLYTQDHWYWICVVVLFGYSILFNVLFILALNYLNPLTGSKGVISIEDENKKQSAGQELISSNGTERGMVLPFQPVTLTFNHINYYVDMPQEIKAQGVEGDHLQLLRDVSGAFRPGILTALIGMSGAGKTTLMDVLAGRKTTGYIDGNIKVSGYPKNQETFARISGYCEQTDMHSPYVTVYESLLFSAWLRLSSDVKAEKTKVFVEDVMELIELNLLRNTLIGVSGVDGLSTEQRKRLTIAVELVANPSIIFMDEPTSGLDARAAAIVMRVVRNTVNTGRTVVCTIHQPGIDIFESFDELLLMKRGGQVIYAGPLGLQSQKLIEYFEAIPGVPSIREGYNPATWILDITTPLVETRLNVDFAEIYVNSSAYTINQEVIDQMNNPFPDSEDLHFPTKYSKTFCFQFKTCFWKQNLSYWRNASYNVIRFVMTIIVGVLFGLIFWQQGKKINKVQDIMNLMGLMYSAILFLGAANASTVQPVLTIERIVFYRERAAGMYSPMAYALGQVGAEIIYNVSQALIYTILLYFMIGFEWSILKFLYFYYFIMMSFIYFTLFGMMLIALTPNGDIGAIVMTFFLSIWNLFAGFIITRPDIPTWWRWYYWASPVSWTLYGLFTSQFGDNNSSLLVFGGPTTTVKNFIEDHFGFDYDFLLVIVFIHIGWVLLFLIVFAYGIKYLNFQKR